MKKALEGVWPVVRMLWPAYLLASVLILCGFRWSLVGDSMSFQSDENAAYLAVSRLSWPRLDPEWYGWGTGLFYQAYALKSVLTIGGLLTISKHGVFLIGRFISFGSVLGAITVTFLLGRRLFDNRTARLAAVILAVLPGLVVNSHYFKTDVPMLVWMMLAILASYRLIAKGGLIDALVLGSLCGYAASIKYSAAILVPVGLVAIAMADRRLPRIRATLAFLVCVALGFFIGEPRVWLDWREILAGVRFVSDLNRQGVGAVSTRPAAWADYPMHVFPLAMTMPVALVAVAGVVPAIRRVGRVLVPIGVLLLFYGVLLSADNQRLVRYATPLLPFAALSAACAIEHAWSDQSAAWRAARLAAASGIVGYAFLFSLSYVRAMTGLDPRIEAVAWITEHAPRAVPIPVVAGRAPTRPPLEPAGYRVVDVNGNIETLAQSLSDYVIVSELPERMYEEDLDAHPAQKAVHDYIASHYVESARFEHSQKLLWIDSKAGRYLAADWILPNPRITILKRVGPPATAGR